MLSNSSKYALKAVLFLAVNSTVEKKISAKELSDSANIPKAYLSKLMQELTRHDLISSVRGPNGGFYLTDENRAQKLLAVVEHIDGLSKLEKCALGLLKCSAIKPCPVHSVIQPLRKTFLYELSTNSIDDFAKNIQEGKTFLNT